MYRKSCFYFVNFHTSMSLYGHFSGTSVFKRKTLFNKPHKIKHLLLQQIVVRHVFFPSQNKKEWSFADILQKVKHFAKWKFHLSGV